MLAVSLLTRRLRQTYSVVTGLPVAGSLGLFLAGHNESVVDRGMHTGNPLTA